LRAGIGNYGIHTHTQSHTHTHTHTHTNTYTHTHKHIHTNTHTRAGAGNNDNDLVEDEGASGPLRQGSIISFTLEHFNRYSVAQ
jgi:hypothetical protein